MLGVEEDRRDEETSQRNTWSKSQKSREAAADRVKKEKERRRSKPAQNDQSAVLEEHQGHHSLQ